MKVRRSVYPDVTIYLLNTEPHLAQESFVQRGANALRVAVKLPLAKSFAFRVNGGWIFGIIRHMNLRSFIAVSAAFAAGGFNTVWARTPEELDVAA